MKQNRNTMPLRFPELPFGITYAIHAVQNYINRNTLGDIFDRLHGDNTYRIGIKLSQDPNLLPRGEQLKIAALVRAAVITAELPYSTQTGANKFDRIAQRVFETEDGSLFVPIVADPRRKRVAVMISLHVMNNAVTYVLAAKRLLNRLVKQGIELNHSTITCLQVMRNHMSPGMIFNLTSTDEAFMDPKWTQDSLLLPEYANTILLKEVFFKEGALERFLYAHQNIRRLTDEVCPWKDSKWDTPISTEGGNFVTNASTNCLWDFETKKPGSNQVLIQNIQSISVSELSPSQEAFNIVYNPILRIEDEYKSQLPQNSMNLSRVSDINPSGVAHLLFWLCTNAGKSNNRGSNRRGNDNAGDTQSDNSVPHRDAGSSSSPNRRRGSTQAQATDGISDDLPSHLQEGSGDLAAKFANLPRGSDKDAIFKQFVNYLKEVLDINNYSLVKDSKIQAMV